CIRPVSGYKFVYSVDQKKTARDILDQLASHLNIDRKLFRSCCSIWIISDLLELQLRESHEPWAVRKKWAALLKNYACADESEIEKDEPLLFLKRNIHLGVEKEKWVIISL
ncbi:unnamed protein product, partial [Enterobius vermicularis]|uniref:Ras-associating domain-containing protein n=1 Tax=Enterobius vermicularis TaxID=51028 RepID=A0A0N4UZR8_ENTVE